MVDSPQVKSKPIIQVIMESGKHPALPDGLEPAIKFVQPDWTTHDGFAWYQPRKKWVTDDGPFNPKTCVAGGLHVANTIRAAQSGGARLTHCLWVGVEPDAGPWDSIGKRKARRVFVAGPVDLVGIICSHGEGADLAGAKLAGAELRGANLRGANLWGADLAGADLWGANLGGAKLRGAYLRDTDLLGVNLGGANLVAAYLRDADLRGANLAGADLEDAYLDGADLRGAYGRSDWDDLVARGAVREPREGNG